MKRQRPVSVLVLAILNILVGALSLVCGTCIAIGRGSTPTPAGLAGRLGGLEDLTTYLGRVLPHHQAVEVGRSVGILFLGIVLILSAVGLLMVHGWGRWLSVGYALLAVVLHSGYMTYQVGFFVPAYGRWIDAAVRQPAVQADPQLHATVQTGQRIGITAGMILVILIEAAFLLHATGLLVVLFLPHVAAAFRRAGAPAPDDDEEDEGSSWGRPRRARDWEDEE